MKRHAGIRDSEPVQAVEAKLEAVLPDGPERQWFRQRLRMLLGLEAPEASREENFAAWTSFIEELAGVEPSVLVFEDLHWADEALLAFLEYLTAHLSAVPLLLWERRGLSSSSERLDSPQRGRWPASTLALSRRR